MIMVRIPTGKMKAMSRATIAGDQTDFRKVVTTRTSKDRIGDSKVPKVRVPGGDQTLTAIGEELETKSVKIEVLVMDEPQDTLSLNHGKTQVDAEHPASIPTAAGNGETLLNR